MSTLLANVTAALDASEPEVSEEPEAAEEAEESESSEEPAEAAPEGEDESEVVEDEPIGDDVINPRKKYRIGDEEILGKDLLNQRLMRADYTRKTQQLAEFRKKLETDLNERTDERDEAVEWIKGLEDVDTLEAELWRHFPKAMESLIQRVIDQAIEEEDAGDNQKHREAIRRARKAELEDRQRLLDEKRNKTLSERKQIAQKTTELRANFDKWTREAMASAGLDFTNEKHRTVFSDRIMSAYGKEAWTQDTFAKTAKYVQDLLGVKPPPKKVAPAAKLPPVAKSGAVAPAKGKAPPPKVRSKDSAEGFAAIRDRWTQ